MNHHFSHHFLLTLLVIVSSKEISTDQTIVRNHSNLTLVTEYKVEKCFQSNKSEEYEASGIIKFQNKLYVVFDNQKNILIVDKELKECINSSGILHSLPDIMSQPVDHLGATASAPTQLLEEEVTPEIGFEAISFYNDTFVVVQEVDAESSELKARIKTFAAPYFQTQLSNDLLDHVFESENKGIEGVALVKVKDDQHFLLALCEGNHCAAGDRSMDDGHGTILVYYQNSTSSAWISNEYVILPSNLHFLDFSGMDVREITNTTGEIAIVSQESHSLYVGNYIIQEDESKPSGHSFQISTDSNSMRIYTFPEEYCNIEGITFLEEGTSSSSNSSNNSSSVEETVEQLVEEKESLVKNFELIGVVSDKRKQNQDERCSVKDQSVHIFKMSSNIFVGSVGEVVEEV
jgi:hypothetical protein